MKTDVFWGVEAESSGVGKCIKISNERQRNRGT